MLQGAQLFTPIYEAARVGLMIELVVVVLIK
jgi:hypothetical protein